MKWFWWAVIIVFFFVLGWNVGLIAEHWDIFHLTFDVPIFNIINLLVISLLAWLVNYSIQNYGRRQKSKIDLLSGKIDEVDSYLKRLVDLTSNENGASYVEICNLDKNCRSWAKRIVDVVEKRYSDVCPKDTYITLTQDLLSLRSLVTNSSIIIEGNTAIVQTDNGIVKYNSQRRAEVSVLIDSIRHILFKVKVCVSQK